MFFYLSLVLVIVAAVTLVIGLLSSGLPLVIVSIICSFAAGVFLILTVVRERPRVDATATPPEPLAPPAAPTASPAVPSVTVLDEGEVDRDEVLEFPIADYDDLRVSEIVPLLSELDDDELDLVREHEESEKARSTILNRIDDLLGEADDAWGEEAYEGEATYDEVEFPIADYDDLRVSEIVPLLPELDDDELEVVREEEAAGRARATILNRIDELLGVAPAPAKASRAASGTQARAKKSFPIADYDDLNVSDVAKRLKTLDIDELEQVRSYESRTKGRKGVLQKVDAELASR